MKIADVAKYSPLHIRIISFLNLMPDDEIITTGELAEKIQASLHTSSLYSHQSLLKAYQENMAMSGRIKTVWGNKKAIAALRKLKLGDLS
jgi:hypothetical protein